MKTNRIFLWMLGCFATLSALQGLQAQTPGLSYPVPLDEAHFPDERFREYLEETINVDKNGDGQLSVEECGDVAVVGLKIERGSLYCDLAGVSSLKGIEYFYALDSLGFYFSSVTSLDVSRNTALTFLVCSFSPLTSLNLSGCTALESLSCDNTQLTNLDLSKNTALTDLQCYFNQLTSLNVSGCTALTDLDCGSNQLTSLNVSGCTALTDLDCRSNQLTSLNVSGCTALTDLDCGSNQLTSLNLSGCTALESLSCDNTQLTSLDLSKNTALTYLDCRSNQLASLDVSGCTALTDLQCYSNQLTSLDLSRNTALTELDCSSNQLMSLDVSGCTALTDLSCTYNDLTSLDLSRNTALTELDCSSNQLMSLDVSSCTALETLYCYDNQLTSLNLSRNTDLTDLYCNNNQLTSLDLSQNTALTDLSCTYNDLTSLNLSRNTALTYLYCNNNQLTSLDLSQNTALTRLRCYDNHLTSLDLSQNTDLRWLDCSDNHLAALDLSQNSRLEDVNAERNYYEVSLDEDGNVDIAAIPGLEADRMADLQGGYIEGNTLHLDADILMYYYDYKRPNYYAPSGGYFYIATDNPTYHVPIDKEHFPDSAFRGYVATSFDRNEDGQLSSVEIRIVSDISVPDREIHDLRGIEHFTFLQSLDCSANNLASLDVSQNTTLTGLDCSDNQLTSLDVSQNTTLTGLNCSDNQLTSLDLSRNTALRSLDCSYNRLAALDLSKNGDLWNVSAEQNYHKVSLDEGRNVDIATIPGLEADRMTDIQGGYIEGNTLHLDADILMYYYDYNSSNYEMPIGAGDYFYITTDNHVPIDKEHFLDTAFRRYVTANIDQDEDGQLSLREQHMVIDIDVSNLGIHNLSGIEYFASLQSLDCSENRLTSLDLSRNTNLVELDCGSNQLSSLDLSQNTALQTLDCSDNALLDLDVRSLSALQELDCSKNQLASLDLFRNANLVSVKADGNYREVLVNQDRQFDISTLPRFERARMEAIEGGTLQGDILTFEQDEVRYFYSYNNTNPASPLGEYFHLKAVPAPVPGIVLNDTTFPDAVFRGHITENADTDKDSLLSESEIAGVTGLDVSGMGIQDLRGIGYFTALQSLDCSDNALTSLDLSANTALQTLNASGNRLDIELDESNAFDVSSLPGFNMAKASDWTGCTRMGNKLTFTQQEVTYAYATGYSGSAEDASLQSVVFSLMADREPSVAPERIVSIDEEHFPDSVFREYITAADLDTDHWLDEDEIAGVTGIDVSGMGIQDLRGIGYFTALESLDCSDNALTSLDLSANTALQMLNASGNRLDIVLDESNAFDVSSLPGFNMAKASDWTGCTRMGNKLTFTQQEVTYAYATGYSGSAEDASLKSVTFSLFADRDPSMGNETSDLQPQGRVYAKDRTLYTEGISGEVSVFTAVGTLVYQGKDTRIPVHQAGTYIVRHGEQVWKILVM